MRRTDRAECVALERVLATMRDWEAHRHQQEMDRKRRMIEARGG